MLDIGLIRENWRELQKRIGTKGVDLDLGELIKVDQGKRELQKKVDDLRATKNRASEKILLASAAEKKRLIGELKNFGQEYDRLEGRLKETTATWMTLMEQLPNPPAPDVKVGRSAKDNEILRTVGWLPDGSYGRGGLPKKFNFAPKDAAALGKSLDLIDTERAAKISGSRFGYLKGGAALLEFALVRYALDRLIPHGFTPIVPPVLVKPEIMRAMGYLARGGEEETYRFTRYDDDLYLVGTSEQSVAPIHAGEMLNESGLPRRYVAFSTCFRREAGSYGKDTKGLLRVHQFDKLEMVTFVKPEEGDAEHERLLAWEEELVSGLEFPYRVVKLCTADLGDPAARTYDIETWLPGQDCYRETHSTSTTTDFQSRRLDIRFRRADGTNEYLHLLNGTAFAIGRMIIALLENYQQADGSVALPAAIHPYLPQGFSRLTPPAAQ